MEPISAFVEAIDRLVNLLQHRKLRRDEYFDRIVEPLFENLFPVLNDIQVFYVDLEELVNLGKIDKESVRIMRIKRNKLMGLRIHVRSSAFAIIEGDADYRYGEFANSVINLFYFSELNDEFVSREKLSRQAKIVHTLEQKYGSDFFNNRNVYSRQGKGDDLVDVHLEFLNKLGQFIKLSSSRLESNWKDVSGRYALLRQERYKF